MRTEGNGTGERTASPPPGPGAECRLAIVTLALFVALPVAAYLSGGSYLIILGTRILTFAIAAMALELLIGVAGIVSFGHAAFVGIGAYATGILMRHGISDMAVALPAALLASALYGLMTGAVAMRTRGVYLIMITLAFGQMAFFVATSLAPYGGDDGLTLAGRSTLLGARPFKTEAALYAFALASGAIVYHFLGRLRQARFGRVLSGLRQNEQRAAALGFAPYPYRLTVYVLAGATAGLSGFLLANSAEFVSPAYLSWQRSGELIVMVILGGTGTPIGPVLGAAAYVAFEEALTNLPRLIDALAGVVGLRLPLRAMQALATVAENWKAVLGPLIILMALYARKGIAGILLKAPRT